MAVYASSCLVDRIYEKSGFRVRNVTASGKWVEMPRCTNLTFPSRIYPGPIRRAKSAYLWSVIGGSLELPLLAPDCDT